MRDADARGGGGHIRRRYALACIQRRLGYAPGGRCPTRATARPMRPLPLRARPYTSTCSRFPRWGMVAGNADFIKNHPANPGMKIWPTDGRWTMNVGFFHMIRFFVPRRWRRALEASCPILAHRRWDSLCCFGKVAARGAREVVGSGALPIDMERPQADLFPFPFLPATRSAPSSKGGLARL